MRILLVEDDIPLAEGLRQSLTREGYSIDWVQVGKECLSAVHPDQTNLVILDLGLPDMDGLDVLKSLKQTTPHTPVLILTARDGIESKVAGLDLGAEDYLAKPFSIDELLARIRVIERRLGTGASSKIKIGTIILDTKANLIFDGDNEIKFSKKEYMLARSLIENAGRVQSKTQLESKLYEWGEEVSSNAIEVHMHNLRKKLPDGFVQTIRGVGYIVRKT